jgi:hypothetical protein
MLRLVIVVGVCVFLSACGGGSGSVKAPGGVNISASISSAGKSASVTFSNSSIASSIEASSSLSSASEASTDLYGLYVALHMGRNNQLLGNQQREDQFFKFVRDNGFNYLIFYELEGLDSNSMKAQQLASLIDRAKSTAGVTQVAAALGSANEADTVVAYNNAYAASARIDVLNVEYEFWNKKNRDIEFAKTISMLEYFRKVASANNLVTEIYIGWIDATEAVSLANVTDRILVHYYRQNDVGIVNFGIERLEWLAAASRKVKVVPIFSNEGPNNTNDLPFMGCWLETNANQQAYRSWKSQYDALEKPWKENIEVLGSTWFIYDKFFDIGTGAVNGCTN